MNSSEWNGFPRHDFVVNGREAFLVAPHNPAPGRPWIWRTEFFGHQPQGDLALLKLGYHAAYINMQNMFGGPESMLHMDAFHLHATHHFGLSKKVVLEGFSRGGLYAFNWAARKPDCVAGIYVDAPVCDFKSWPGGLGKGQGSPGDWAQCKAVYGLTQEQALAYRQNPIDVLAPIAAARIPILSICGDADTVVPFEENTVIIAERYRALGGKITVIAKPGVGHHPHSLEDPQPIVDFVLAATK